MANKRKNLKSAASRELREANKIFAKTIENCDSDYRHLLLFLRGLNKGVIKNYLKKSNKPQK